MLPQLRPGGRLSCRIDNSGAPYPAADMNSPTRINRNASGGSDGRGLLDRALAVVGAGTPVVAPSIGEHHVGIAPGNVQARCRAARWKRRLPPCRRHLRVSRRHRREDRGMCRPGDNAGRRHRCPVPCAALGRDRCGSSTPRHCRTRAGAMQFTPEIRAMVASGDVFAIEPHDDARTAAMPGESRDRTSAGPLRAAMTLAGHLFEEASGRLAAFANARDHAA